jgi:metal-responsive CopG/Arc/MetJ family transcriptional regulator
MATRTGNTRTFTVSFPAQLAEQVERTAAAEHRTISELFREAFRTYRAVRVRELLDQSNAEAEARGHNGYTEEDVPRLVREVRAEMAAEKSAAKSVAA